MSTISDILIIFISLKMTTTVQSCKLQLMLVKVARDNYIVQNFYKHHI